MEEKGHTHTLYTTSPYDGIHVHNSSVLQKAHV